MAKNKGGTTAKPTPTKSPLPIPGGYVPAGGTKKK